MPAMSVSEQLRGIRESGKCAAVLLDMDDTVISSSIILWNPGFHYFADNLAGLTGGNAAEILAELATVNNRIYRESAMGVHPSKYGRIAEELAVKHRADPIKVKEIMKETMKMIYLGTPPLIPEAKAVMDELRGSGYKLGLVTHSPKGRTDRMVEAWGLTDRLPVFIESTLVKKGPEVWRRAVAGIGVDGKLIVGVGDNLEGDIMASREAGVMHGVWVKPHWIEFAKGQLPEGVVQIENIGQLAEAIISIFS
jgi:FMN phosphatase YigB (HAD superfamily)